MADDDELNRRLTEMILRQAGYAATVVESGEEALQALVDATYDLVLLDVEMPGLSGPETAQLIRRDHPSSAQSITIVALTAHSGRMEHEHCLASGMDGVVVKPISLEALLPWLTPCGDA